MSNEIIIPGKLEAAALGAEVGCARVQGCVVILNTDYEYYNDTKAKFVKALHMNNHKIVRLMFRQPKTKDETLMQLAAKLAYYQREAEAIIKLQKANDEVEAYLDGKLGGTV